MKPSLARLARASLCIAVTSSIASALAPQKLRQARVRPEPLVQAILIDFETEDDFVTPLVNGQSLSSPGEFGELLALSGSGANAGPAIFDSRPGGPNDPSQDTDLLVDLGNVLILQNSQASTQTTPGIFDRPNDDQDGGSLAFDFASPGRMLSVTLVDIDAGSQQASSVTLRDELGRTRVYTVPPRWTRDLVADGAPGFGTLDLTTLAPQAGFLSTATAQEQAGFEAERVVRLVVTLGSSGAVDDLRWTPGRSLGLVTDADSGGVCVFDADQDARIGNLVLPDGILGTCVIDARRSLGYVAGTQGRVWVVDLALTPPALAGGVNPIVVAGFATDLALSHDGRFLAAALGFRTLSIVDLATRTEVAALPPGPRSDSVAFCADGSVLAADRDASLVRRFALDAAGVPTPTGEALALPAPMNLSCAPGGVTAVAISDLPARVTSLVVDGLVQLDTLGFATRGQSACFSSDGRRLAFRTQERAEVRAYDPRTGAIGAVPQLTFLFGDSSVHVPGVERLAFHPDGTRLYTLEGGFLLVSRLTPGGGPAFGSIQTALARPKSIAVARGLR